MREPVRNAVTSSTKVSPGTTGRRKRASFMPVKSTSFDRDFDFTQRQDRATLGERFNHQTPGITGAPGKWP